MKLTLTCILTGWMSYASAETPFWPQVNAALGLDQKSGLAFRIDGSVQKDMFWDSRLSSDAKFETFSKDGAVVQEARENGKVTGWVLAKMETLTSPVSAVTLDYTSGATRAVSVKNGSISFVARCEPSSPASRAEKAFGRPAVDGPCVIVTRAWCESLYGRAGVKIDSDVVAADSAKLERAFEDPEAIESLRSETKRRLDDLKSLLAANGMSWMRARTEIARSIPLVFKSSALETCQALRNSRAPLAPTGSTVESRSAS